ncbi:hypothetical protein [Sphingobacterium deserti]|uniref:Uncharacterized protein n=1 Tax=Sphingobacterium deserti TaxID=1229276 RepID=A0A0B8T6G2_9SPHI|nr:hypothetical protein [Sphingobacterium deserti]KGE13624.1 hypothetical protein DI53_2545 [Sphingobacterium deserti]
MLDIKLKYLTTQENITAGSIVSTHFDLSRVSDASQTGNTNGCRTIVWENRNVFNLYSGGVDLIRVPVCHN